MYRMNVLITDSVHPVCPETLSAAGMDPILMAGKPAADIETASADADGWIIRSGTTITAAMIDAAPKLKVIGRAGVGVDNVDIAHATRKGILVLNAPAGNTVSTAEHTVAMLLSLARKIPAAAASLKGGAWERKAFTGHELYGKTVGIVGVGKIGRGVAERLAGFGVHLLGFDPVMSEDAAERMGMKLVSLDAIYADADFITVHTPMTASTRGLLNRATLAACRKGVGIVNCARGGIVDEADLLEALESGHVGGAALDVYSSEPPTDAIRRLIEHPSVVATPHIAASTEEAQENVARQVTEQVIHALRHEPVQTAVNAMAIKMASQPEVRPFMDLAERLGNVAAQLSGLESSVTALTVRCHGDVPRRYADVMRVAALKGFLAHMRSEPVNLINADTLAGESGLDVNVETFRATSSYTNVLEIAVSDHGAHRTVSGSVFGDDDPRIVSVDGYAIEVRAEGVLLLYRNEDRPGMLARVGTILAGGGVNIASMALGRKEKGSTALTAMHLDDAPDHVLLADVVALEGVSNIHVVSFPS